LETWRDCSRRNLKTTHNLKKMLGVNLSKTLGKFFILKLITPRFNLQLPGRQNSSIIKYYSLFANILEFPLPKCNIPSKWGPSLLGARNLNFDGASKATLVCISK